MLSLLERAVVIGVLPRSAEPGLDPLAVALGEMVKHVAFLMLHAALHWHVVADHLPYAFLSAFQATHHPTQNRICQATAAQIRTFVLLDEQCAGEADHCGVVGEDADDVGAAADLFVDALERVGRAQLGPVLAGNVWKPMRSSSACSSSGGAQGLRALDPPQLAPLQAAPKSGIMPGTRLHLTPKMDSDA